MPRTLSPISIANEAGRALRSNGNPERAAHDKSYFKANEKVFSYGVNVPSQRKIAKDLYNVVRKEWDISHAIDFCDLMLQKHHLEARSVGILLLSRYEKNFTEDLFDRAERWFLDNRCDNWALTDTLSPLVVSPLIRRFPHLVRRTTAWVKSDNLWLRRAAAVSLIPRVRKNKCMDEAYHVASSLFSDREDLIQKATGWLLREAGKKDMIRLESFLLSNGPKVRRTALRYAIERFPEKGRQRILALTRQTLPAPSKSSSKA